MRNRDDKDMTNVDRSSGSEVQRNQPPPRQQLRLVHRPVGSSGDKNIGSDRLRDDKDSRHSDNSGSKGGPAKDRHF